MKKENLNHADRSILLELFRSGGELSVYTIHRKYHLSPGEISNSIRKFKKAYLITSRDLRIKLTKKGKEWLLNLGPGFIGSEEKPWRKCPKVFKGKQLEINEPYIPIVPKLSKAILKHAK